MRLKTVLILAFLMVLTGIICKRNEPCMEVIETEIVTDTVYVETREPIDTVIYLY